MAPGIVSLHFNEFNTFAKMRILLLSLPQKVDAGDTDRPPTVISPILSTVQN